MTIAFSYIRFSSEGQRHGSSVARQLDAANAYAATHNLTLDTSTYRDLGISAFRSKNRVEGALGAFIEAVDEGKVPAGSFLLIESFDRLSRDSVDLALELFLNLCRKGITVVTLMDQQVYSQATIRDNWTTLIMALAVMARANEESVTKSRRVKESYVRRREQGGFGHTRFPSWLRKTDSKTLVVIPEKAAVINRIFDLALEGYGTRIIARTLHKEGVPTLHWAKEWNQALVHGLLNSISVYGEKDGREDYYPPIMSKDKFLMATAAVRGRKWKTTRSPTIPNLFSGLAFCAVCGSRVRYVPNLESPRLRCKKALDNQDCTGKTYSYSACETAFMYVMTRKAGLNISGEYLIQSRNAGAAIQGEIEQLKDKQKNLLKLATLAAGVEAVADELNLVQRDIQKLEDQLAMADKVPLSRKELSGHRDVFDAYYAAKEAKSPDLIDIKRKVRVAMARLFKKIEFGVGKNHWEPTMFITLVDGTKALVDVTPFLHHRSLSWTKTIKVKPLSKTAKGLP
jgi:DNA invertase Pin-like site-specific DNA recombinase